MVDDFIRDVGLFYAKQFPFAVGAFLVALVFGGWLAYQAWEKYPAERPFIAIVSAIVLVGMASTYPGALSSARSSCRALWMSGSVADTFTYQNEGCGKVVTCTSDIFGRRCLGQP
jgi:hypothetical protein